MAQTIKSKFNNLLQRSKEAIGTNYFKLMVKGTTGIYYAHPTYGHADYNKHRVCDITPYTLRLMKQFNANFNNQTMQTPIKFNWKEKIQLEEIKRRIKEFKAGDKNEPMIYLGFPSEVKTLKEKGVLKPYSKETPRALNWYNLTEFGKSFF